MPRSERSWVALLTASEQAALQESEYFFERPDGRLRRLAGAVGRPLSRVLGIAPDGLQKRVTDLIDGVLTSVAHGAEGDSGQRKLIDELCRRGGFELDPFDRIYELDHSILAQVSQADLAQAKNLATLSGGTLGLAGAPGLLADLPSLYFLLFRTVHRIALCWGHPANSERERIYLMKVVHVGHFLELRDRRLGLLDLDAYERGSRKQERAEDVQRTVLGKTVQQLSRTLTSHLLQRKAAQAVAVVGGAVGAALNRQLVEDVGRTAFHAYRRRYFRDLARQRRLGEV